MSRTVCVIPLAATLLSLAGFCAVPVQAEQDDPAIDRSNVELVQERYPNRMLKLEREVTLDADNNYVNHGSWTYYDPRQNILAKGSYRFGKRHGVWEMRYTGTAAKRLTDSLRGYSQPILSVAEFDDGVLAGSWVALDSEHRKVFEIPFVDGQRHGLAVWYYPNGRKRTEITYIDGIPEGEHLEFNEKGEVARRILYQRGRRLDTKVEYHRRGQKKSEGTFLFPKVAVKSPDDYSAGRLAVYTTVGQPIRHGSFKSWYENGQINSQAEYNNGVQIGRFLYWHANGQKAVEGYYDDGERVGEWTWYHLNGLKSATGEFADGQPVGEWLWWEESGQLAKQHDFSAQAVAALPDDLPSGSGKEAKPIKP